MTDAGMTANKAQASGLKLLLIAIGVIFLGMLLLPIAVGIQVLYEETKGPFHHTTNVVDLDGDGDLDVVLHNIRYETEMTQWSGVTLWINQGGGRFTSFNPQIGSSAASAGDVDGDGDIDLVALAQDQLTVFLNQGGAQGGVNGSFRRNKPILPPIRVPDGPGMRGTLALGDLNGDGQIDGLVAGCCGMSNPPKSGDGEYAAPFSWVWINQWDPKGWLVKSKTSLSEWDGLPVGAAVLGDLDGDGDADVFAAVRTPKPGRTSDPADRVLLNDGQGNLIDPGQRLGTSDGMAAALGDLDGDSDLDALVGIANGAEVWVNQGGAQAGKAGSFFQAEKNLPGSQSGQVFLNDLDGDGDLDALIGGARQAVAWRNDGSGNFTPMGPPLRYPEHYGLALGDFNADGRADVFAGGGGEEYQVWVNQGDGRFR